MNLRVKELLGVAAFGQVHRVVDDVEEAGLKVIRQRLDLEKQVFREETVMQILTDQHQQAPFVLQLLDECEHQNEVFLLLELCSGRCLCPLSSARLYTAAAQLLEAMTFGILHRDLKPDNVLFTG